MEHAPAAYGTGLYARADHRRHLRDPPPPPPASSWPGVRASSSMRRSHARVAGRGGAPGHRCRLRAHGSPLPAPGVGGRGPTGAACGRGGRRLGCHRFDRRQDGPRVRTVAPLRQPSAPSHPIEDVAPAVLDRLDAGCFAALPEPAPDLTARSDSAALKEARSPVVGSRRRCQPAAGGPWRSARRRPGQAARAGIAPPRDLRH